MDILMQKKFYWTYLAGFFLIVLQIINVVPVWSTPTGWGKVIVFRTITAILLFLFIYQIFFKKIDFNSIIAKIKSISLVFWLLTALSVVFLVSTIFSQDPHFSLWGDPQRNGGTVNYIFYIIFSILTFIIIKRNDWKKIWIFSIFISIIISLITIFQYLGLFSYYLVSESFRPQSLLGNPILLSLYLALMTFITLSFGIKERGKYKRFFYFSSAFLFLAVNVFLAQTRGTIAGIAVGIIWFALAYPGLKKKTRIYGIVSLLLIVLVMFSAKVYLDSHLDVYKKIPPLISSTIDRTLSIFEGSKVMESRISAWTIAFNGVKEKPILGWGPENFMVAFDKHYDPSLPLVGPDERGILQVEWWDRAHSVFFEMSSTTGIPSFIIYFLIFASLILLLQKSRKSNPEKAIIINGLQATFIAYFIALLFSFDCVSTYIIFFLLVGYSLFLISGSNPERETQSANNLTNKLYPYRLFIIIPLFLLLIIFVYFHNIKPFYLNKEVNLATLYSENNLCQDGLEITDIILPQIEGGIIDNYLNRKAMLVIYGCIRNEQVKDPALINKALEIIKETTNSHPAYLQNWILLGEFSTLALEEETKKTSAKFVSTPRTEQLKKQAIDSFKKAHDLSPKRQIVLNNWADTYIVTEEYQEAKEKLNQCIGLNSNYVPCLWKMALAQGYSSNMEGFNHFYQKVEEKKFNIESEDALKQLVDMYIKIGDYEEIAKNYQKLIEIEDDPQQKAQLHASLAGAYVELGQTDNAKKEAQKILELIPYFPYQIQNQAKKDIETFINSLTP